MTSRDRVRKTIHFQGPDRMPHLLYDGGENDILWLWSLRPGGTDWKTDGNDHWTRLDSWGGHWERFGPEGNGELVVPPLADWADADAMKFPDSNNPACFEDCRKQIAANPDLYKLGVLNYGLFEGPETVRRIDNLLMDFCEAPEELDRLIGRFADAQIELIDTWAALGADGIMSYDDLGLQERPMLSVEMFRAALLPHYKRVWAHAHSRGLDVWMHSCGYIMPFLDDMIDAGLNVIQMDQQENMGIAELGRRFGGRLAFWCPVDIQQTMVKGTEEEIDAYALRMVRYLGSYGGGLISKAYPQPDVIGHDPAKTAAMCRAFRKYQSGAPGLPPEGDNPTEIAWTHPSRNSSGAMPIGNGDISVNAWVETGGDLLLYVGKNDSWDENGRLLKLGRLRLHFSPAPFAEGEPFRQTLSTERGEIEIVAGKPEQELRVRLWVDANRPVVRIETESDREFTLETRLEIWRTTARELPKEEDHCPIGKLSEDELTKVTPDTILSLPAALAWHHRNERSVWANTLRLQEIESLIPKFKDPLLGLTSGALVRGNNLEVADRTTLRPAKPGTQFTVSVHPLVAQTADAGNWLEQLEKQADASDLTALHAAREEHLAWWKAFWLRSHITVTGSQEAAVVTRGYNLERFFHACGSRGRFPMKFNGSIFNVDGVGPKVAAHPHVPEVYDADFRMWGGGYWFQNCRLIYWPMLMSGDFDLMQPFFRLYREALGFAEARTRYYFNHAGAYFSETMAFWGANLNENYGYDRTGETPVVDGVPSCLSSEKKVSPLKPGLTKNSFIRRYWQGGIELVCMMLDYHSITQDEKFLNETLLPVARQILAFFHEHFTDRDHQGNIRFEPAQSLETWHDASNPMPEIAGLRWATDWLLQISGLPKNDRESWAALRELLPPLPSRTEVYAEKTYLLPAQQFDIMANMENPELYAVFPYRHFGVGKPHLEVGRETYKRRINTDANCWHQQAIQSALLGLTDEAKRDVVLKFSSTHLGSRYPANWGPYYDWIPDHDNGGVAMAALQRMLLQSDGDRILLFPAWPKEWDVSFKLHAPKKTAVECVFQSGEIKSLKVSPASRRKDVEFASE